MKLSEVYSIIQSTALSHLQVESFNSGEGFERNVNGNVVYPQCYLLRPLQITSNERTEVYSITFEVLDLDRSDKANTIDIISTNKTIGLEIIEKLRITYPDQFQVSNDITVITVENYTDDDCTGAVFNFDLTLPKEVNRYCIDGKFN
jgi:hypothetical protein